MDDISTADVKTCLSEWNRARAATDREIQRLGGFPLNEAGFDKLRSFLEREQAAGAAYEAAKVAARGA
ncbi:hypothetical protein [Nocardioides sp. KR10-350]|uniref:hypothetical protein n=1 Tax=Nocardioides cheoyonin TaxID=3156615 RepID=UPI0032B48E2E